MSEVVSENCKVVAHYEHAPFGAVSLASGVGAFVNSFRYSSEFADDEISFVYYNYRHYDAKNGRWLRKDPLSEDADLYGSGSMVEERNFCNILLFAINSPVNLFDRQGTDPQRSRQIVNNIILLGSWWNKSCARCGPDITDSLKRLRSNVVVEFELLKKANPGKARSSCSIFSPSAPSELFYATSGWDIIGLAFTDVRIRNKNGVSKCPFGDGCSETVTVNGQCHWKWSVNYVLFGWMAKLCDCPKNRMSRLIRLWKLTKPKDYGKIQSAVSFAESAYDGFPDSGSVLEETEHEHCKPCDKLNAIFGSNWPSNAPGGDARWSR